MRTSLGAVMPSVNCTKRWSCSRCSTSSSSVTGPRLAIVGIRIILGRATNLGPQCGRGGFIHQAVDVPRNKAIHAKGDEAELGARDALVRHHREAEDVSVVPSVSHVGDELGCVLPQLVRQLPLVCLTVLVPDPDLRHGPEA